MPTREQERAQRAYTRVSGHCKNPKEAEYKRFAQRFPALVQANGLAQAVAFAQAKDQRDYLADLASVVEPGTTPEVLAERARKASLVAYQKLSRDALAAAGWLKRYAEALLKGDENNVPK